MLVLAVETSCDETSVALVDSDASVANRVMAHTIRSQIALHQATKGVVPEVAARAHLDLLAPAYHQIMHNVDLEQVDAIAATIGPGLIGGLLVGSSFAKSLSLASGKPFVAVNHLAGHAPSVRLSDDVPFPYLMLLVSGGHCQILVVEGVGQYRRWGTTIDDAVGEAFDKVGRLLELPYPGGPHLETLAQKGNPSAFALPHPMVGRPGCDFSFSGLKTAVYRQIEKQSKPLSYKERADLAASFQAAVVASLQDRVHNAVRAFVKDYGVGLSLAVVGGVAANKSIRNALCDLAHQADMSFVAPPIELCGDNAAMIGWAAAEHFHAGGGPSPLDELCRPRYPLDPHAPRSRFAGAVKA